MIISPYLLVYAFLLAGAAACVIRRRDSRVLFILSFALLTVFLTLRYGQGTDYFAYRLLYYVTPAKFDINYILRNRNLSEPLFKLLFNLFRCVNAPYWVFVGILSLCEMALLCRFVCRFCPQGKSLALLLLYPVLYLTYCFSVLRQGLAVCIFLGLMLPLLLHKKWLAYFALAAVCTGIHLASFILFALPFVLVIRLKWWKWLLPLCALLGLGLSSPLGQSLMRRVYTLLKNKSASYLNNAHLSPAALAERAASFAVLAFFYYEYARQEKARDKTFDVILSLYCAGFGLYLLLCWSPLISSRMIVPMKAMEIALFPFLIWKLPKRRWLLLMYIAALTLLMTCKNLNAYLNERYYAESAFWRYPYYSLLDKRALADKSMIPANLRMYWMNDIAPVIRPHGLSGGLHRPLTEIFK